MGDIRHFMVVNKIISENSMLVINILTVSCHISKISLINPIERIAPSCKLSLLMLSVAEYPHKSIARGVSI